MKGAIRLLVLVTMTAKVAPCTELPLRHKPACPLRLQTSMTAVGFEPTPFRNGALSHRLRPLGQTVLRTAHRHHHPKLRRSHRTSLHTITETKNGMARDSASPHLQHPSERPPTAQEEHELQSIARLWAHFVSFPTNSSKTLPGRLELPTLRLTASRSNQLS